MPERESITELIHRLTLEDIAFHSCQFYDASTLTPS